MRAMGVFAREHAAQRVKLGLHRPAHEGSKRALCELICVPLMALPQASALRNTRVLLFTQHSQRAHQ